MVQWINAFTKCLKSKNMLIISFFKERKKEEKNMLSVMNRERKGTMEGKKERKTEILEEDLDIAR